MPSWPHVVKKVLLVLQFHLVKKMSSDKAGTHLSLLWMLSSLKIKHVVIISIVKESQKLEVAYTENKERILEMGLEIRGL